MKVTIHLTICIEMQNIEFLSHGKYQRMVRNVIPVFNHETFPMMILVRLEIVQTHNRSCITCGQVLLDDDLFKGKNAPSSDYLSIRQRTIPISVFLYVDSFLVISAVLDMEIAKQDLGILFTSTGLGTGSNFLGT